MIFFARLALTKTRSAACNDSAEGRDPFLRGVAALPVGEERRTRCPHRGNGVSGCSAPSCRVSLTSFKWLFSRRAAEGSGRRWNAVPTGRGGCDDERGGMGCCDPQSVSASVSSVFLAAAARACSNPETAERLERAVDAKYLRRDGGLYFLDLNREWRIGATAMRIISLAESNGSRFEAAGNGAISAE